MKTLLVTAMVLLSLQLNAQKNLTDSLIQRIDSLESALMEKNYSRIPIGDFDKNLDVRVQAEVYSVFYRWLAVLGILLFGGGFGLYRSLESELKKKVEEAVKDNVKDLAEIQNRENVRQDTLIKAMTENIEVLAGQQKSFLSDVSGNVEKKISEATQMIWNDIADNKLRTAKESNYKGGPLAKELNDFLDNESVKVSMGKKRNLVDSLMRCFYNTPESELKLNGYSGKFEEMIKLLKKHESKIDLLPETYVNAAIALTNNYEYYKNEEDKRLSIDCCDKALLKLKDYGIAFVLKLEIYCIDYKKAYDKAEQEASLDQLRRIFHLINNNESRAMLYEAILRLKIDKKVAYLKPYLQLLEIICADELLTLKEKAARYFVLPEVMRLEEYKIAFTDMMSEASMTTTNMNGKWKAIKSFHAGVEKMTEDVNIEIDINGYEYLLKEGDAVSSGYIHFLPFSQKPAINLYIFDEKMEYTQTAFCISKVEADGVWKLCSNYDSDVRPEDFVSTGLNKYYYDELVKM